MAKEREPRGTEEKIKSLAKKVLGWAIVVGGVAVGLNWFLQMTSGL